MHSVLHVEDDPLWAACVAKIIRETDSLHYWGRVSTAQGAWEICGRRQPQIVILDLILPDGDGLELARQLRKLPAAPRIIFLTIRVDEAALYHLSHPGVGGLVWKSTFLRTNLRKAIAAAVAGQKYVPPEIREALRAFRSDPNAFFKKLSERELELLPLFGRGDTDDEIAASKRIEPLTVKSHRSHIMHKLGVHRTEQLMKWCVAKGFSRSAPLAAVDLSEAFESS